MADRSSSTLPDLAQTYLPNSFQNDEASTRTCFDHLDGMTIFQCLNCCSLSCWFEESVQWWWKGKNLLEHSQVMMEEGKHLECWSPQMAGLCPTSLLDVAAVNVMGTPEVEIGRRIL